MGTTAPPQHSSRQANGPFAAQPHCLHCPAPILLHCRIAALAADPQTATVRRGTPTHVRRLEHAPEPLERERSSLSDGHGPWLRKSFRNYFFPEEEAGQPASCIARSHSLQQTAHSLAVDMEQLGGPKATGAPTGGGAWQGRSLRTRRGAQQQQGAGERIPLTERKTKGGPLYYPGGALCLCALACVRVYVWV